jgi:26S proteasome regulatory subunit T1
MGQYLSAENELTEDRDIQVLKTYGAAPYAAELKNLDKQIKEKQASVNEKIGS